MIKLHQALKDARLQRGLSQTQAAQRIGLKNNSAMTIWETTDYRMIPLVRMKALCELYRVDIEPFYQLWIDERVRRYHEKMEHEVKVFKNTGVNHEQI